MITEGVLIFGASGNVGLAAVFGALRSRRRAIAVVRSEKSADTLRATVARNSAGDEHGARLEVLVADLSTVEGYSTVVAKAAESEGAEGAGGGKGFQHVWTSMIYQVGGDYHDTPLLKLDRDFMREMMIRNFEPNLIAYQTAMPYLLSLPPSIDATFTMCTGSQGEIGERAQPAMVQGALFSMANVACRENKTTNVRFNEVYLAFRVQIEDSATSPWGERDVMSSSEFGKVYEQIMDGDGKEVRSCRFLLEELMDAKKLRFVQRPNTGRLPYSG